MITINDELFYRFTFSSNTNTSHRDVRQHSSRHPARSCCSTESMNFAPSFFESSVRIILSSCTSNLFAHSNGSTVAAIPAHAIAKIRRKQTGVILSRLNKTRTSHCILLCNIIYYYRIIMCAHDVRERRWCAANSTAVAVTTFSHCF